MVLPEQPSRKGEVYKVQQIVLCYFGTFILTPDLLDRGCYCLTVKKKKGGFLMESISLLFFVFVLGLRHGLDADHLACIDGLTRYNWRMGTSISRWVGTLFSFGHGFVVAVVGITLALFSKNFTFPDYFDTVVTWVSIISLFLIGTLNIYNLVRKKSEENDFQPQGIKGKFLPKFVKETTNPFLIILIGGIFALAADTVSQTSVWALAAGHSGNYMPFILGITFMIGMMITDTIDSLVVYRMMTQSSKVGQSASRIMGWIIVFLAYGVSFYEALTYFNPSMEVDFEMVGVTIFLFLVLCYAWVSLRAKSENKAIVDQTIEK
ncbi:high-affinity nickel-transport protein [Aneurinibacillus soli]|uniref:Nickel/cobalt efflux system n=1 Tax=Aneurinibacillus soli TaxID=1500254 RepID=A0A0U5AWB2_9BACL|nr:sodium:proton antiporter [Aneurinibacillus soli]PYE64088.1 high-affinity nickel-transport protein [Aneurinibacillus soli]BAU28037.1 High-affinity nickel transport protein [Aneurinibacillus soli]